jgi:hypothetical protein
MPSARPFQIFRGFSWMGILVVFLILVGPTDASAEDRRFGMQGGTRRINKIPLSMPLLRGDSYQDLPVSVTLKRFTPTPGDQGDSPSSPAWAVAYGALTCMKAIQLNLTDQRSIDSLRASPHFLYALTKDTADANCETPVDLTRVLEVLKEVGTPRMEAFGVDCGRRARSHDSLNAASNRITDYKRLTEENYDAKRIPIRKCLAEGKPVIVGLYTTHSFGSAGEMWHPDFLEYNALSYDKPHALTVIGYDDEKYNGAFELLNSFGEGWGNGGYVWIPYADFERLCFCAIELVIPPLPRETTSQKSPIEEREWTLTGAVALFERSGEKMPGDAEEGIFRLRKPYPSGQYFHAQVHARNECFVYAFASDNTDLRAAQIFPRQNANISSHVDANSIFLIPGPSEDHYSYLDNVVGTDYLCFLFSRVNLDFANIRSTFDSVRGDFYTKLRRSLGKMAVAAGNLEFASGDWLTIATSDSGSLVLPLVIEIHHTAKAFEQSPSDTLPPTITIQEPSPNLFKKLPVGVEESNPVRGASVIVKGEAVDEDGIERVEIDGKHISYSGTGQFEYMVDLPRVGTNEIVVKASDNRGNSTIRVYRIIRSQ